MYQKFIAAVFLLSVFFLCQCNDNKDQSSAATNSKPDPAKVNDSLAFGDKNWISQGLEGKIYYLPENTSNLPGDFDTLKVQGTIYTKTIDVPSRSWSTGFPGVGNRFEWFAIVYKGILKPEKAGRYTFRLSSDDGSKLFIDDSLVINNDGLHPVSSSEGAIDLDRSAHHITLQYFQGPRYYVSLQLFAHPDKEEEQIFPGNNFTLSTPGNHSYKKWIIAGALLVIILIIIFLRSRRKDSSVKT
jgi:hypothetical protein